jgi:hypothetical protein
MVVVCVLAACGGIGGIDAPAETAELGGGGAGTQPLTIRGTPRASVAVGRTYNFQPVAANEDGRALTFSAQNLPTWLSLDASNGRLTGTPTEADVGTYAGITLNVSNGASNASLGPFTLTVVAYGDGTASLSWTPPTENSDGSALRDLAGFVILYGFSPDELTESTTIDDPSVTRYVVEGLTSGTWYFAVQATNASGARSEASSVASKTIG